VIIRHQVGVPGLKKIPILLLFLAPASLAWLSCGAASPSTGTGSSGLKYRAFLTNNVSAGSASAGIDIVDAINDVRAITSPISAGNTPGMMVLTPNRVQTLVFSGNGTQFSDNQFSIINNANEQNAGHLTLPGMTQSFVVSPDSSTAYVAVPSAPVAGQPSPGIIDVISLSSGTLTTTISCPPLNPNPPNPPPPPMCVTQGQGDQGINLPYTLLSMGNTGTRLLAFSQSQSSNSVADTIAVITPSSVGTPNPVVTFVSGFDHPVAAFFTGDDTTAYVLNCGPECGGTQASIQTLDLTTNTPGPSNVVCTPGGNPPCIGTVVLPAGSVALVNGSTLYVAGTPLSPPPCTGQTTAATTCGLLTIVDLNTLSVIQPAVQPPYCPAGQQCPIVITDGYHTHLSLAANGQLFIGARNCTEIVPDIPPPTGAEIRGCLSIYNTLTTADGTVPAGGVVIPPETGDVTGIQPIATRDVVYVVQGQSIQGGTLYIYDTTIDALEYNPNNPNNPGQVFGLIGNFIDVKTVDF